MRGAAPSAVALVRGALDPVLVPAGFLAGQGDEDPDGGGQVIFCIGHDELSDRYPHLPQAHQQDPYGTCDDLVVDVWPNGTLGGLRLETSTLAATLRHVGLGEEGAGVEAVTGRAVAEAVPVVAAALERLFRAT